MQETLRWGHGHRPLPPPGQAGHILKEDVGLDEILLPKGGSGLAGENFFRSPARWIGTYDRRPMSAHRPILCDGDGAALPLQPSQLAARFHAPLVSFFLRRINDRPEAEDLAQETLLRIVAARGLEAVQHPEAFVFKVAINLLRDRRRKQLRGGPAVFVPIEDALADEAEGPLVEGLSPEHVLLGRDSLAEVLQSLRELGERTHDIFVLFRLENMKQRDIAALFGIGRSTVEKHVMKATLHLARRYGQTGGKRTET